MRTEILADSDVGFQEQLADERVCLKESRHVSMTLEDVEAFEKVNEFEQSLDDLR